MLSLQSVLVAVGVSGLLPAQRLAPLRPAAAPAASGVSMLSVAQEKKAEQVEQLREVLAPASLAFAVRSEGITVNNMNMLRQK